MYQLHMPFLVTLTVKFYTIIIIIIVFNLQMFQDTHYGDNVMMIMMM